MANPNWVKGVSGNPQGRRSEKPFADALKMEIAAAGSDQKALRAIARNLIALAQMPSRLGVASADIIADRLDGKPAQETNMTIEKRDATDWTLAELVDFVRERRADRTRDRAPRRGADEPDQLH